MVGLQTKYGLGHHAIDQNLAYLTPLLAVSFVGRFLYLLVIFFTKLGICTFYLRVFQDSRSKLFIRLTIAFLVVTEIPLLLLVLLACIPIQGSWDLKPAKCMDFSVSAYITAAFHITTDIMLIAFVIPRVGKQQVPLSSSFIYSRDSLMIFNTVALQMNRRQKGALLAVVSLGILVIVASIIRCVLIIQLPVIDFQCKFSLFRLSMPVFLTFERAQQLTQMVSIFQGMHLQAQPGHLSRCKPDSSAPLLLAFGRFSANWSRISCLQYPRPHLDPHMDETEQKSVSIPGGYLR